MARTIAEIQQEMIDAKNADANLADLTSTSQTALYNLIFFITAASINLFEQLLDAFRTEMEALVETNVAGTVAWARDQTLKFQYDAGDPQVIQLIDFVPSYPVVDESKRIVTQAAVIEGGAINNKAINIKAAKGTVPALTKLDGPEITALESYWDKIRFAGTEVNIVSLDPDLMRVEAEIFYDGQVGSVNTKNNVKDAINNFLASFSDDSFGGAVLISALTDAIQLAEGVKDVRVDEVKARPDSIPFSGASIVQTKYLSAAGYLISENTVGETLDDTLSMTLFS